MNKREELAEINTNVMPIKKHKWIGNVLVAQSKDDNGWAVFWPENGASRSASSYGDAVKIAKGNRNPSAKKRISKALKKYVRSVTKKKNPAGVHVKNFTGTITKLPNGTVLVKGRKKK